MRKESGVVLLTTLMFIVLLGVMSGGIFLVIGNDLAGSANYRDAGDAMEQAQAGLEYVLSRMRQDLNADPAVSVNDLDPAGYEAPEGYRFEPARIGEWADTPPYSLTVIGRGSGGSRFRILARFTNGIEVLPAFRYGMLAGGDIHLSRIGWVNGDVHANRNLTRTGSGDIRGNASACGEVLASVTPGKRAVGIVLSRQVPRVPESFPEEAENRMDPAWEEVNGYYRVPAEWEMKPGIARIEGNVRLEGLVSGAVLATGDIVVEGAVGKPGATGWPVLMARGSIRYRSAQDGYGVFWCNRDFLWEGEGTIHGIIVAGEDIQVESGGGFVADTRVDAPFLPRHREIRLLDWTRVNG